MPDVSSVVTVTQVRIGVVQAYGPNGEPSAIDKQLASGPVRLSEYGFSGDQQGDRRHHGGLDKAVHHYAAEHYAGWQRALPQLPAERFAPGGFGENISTVGLTEQTVCVGDVFRLGSALVQVTQARQPCWKLNLRFGDASMARQVQASGHTGWYYRVLQAGEVAAGDALALLERPYPDWPLARLLHHLYLDPLNREALAAMAAIAVLPPSWRQLAEKRLASAQVEDWSRRLDSPALHDSQP